MIERLILVALLAALAYGLYGWYTRRQLQRISARQALDPVLQGLRAGVPAIVYFTTPHCIPCKTQQQPALQRLQSVLGDAVQVVQIDATQQPDVADRWGVLSAPTTFVIAADGEARAVNHGPADEHTLRQQLGVR